MSGGNEKEGGSSPRISIGIGKEIDAALGDVIRGLLRKPAEETGNLLAEGIGILGDIARRKRELNAHIGIEKTRNKLEANNTDLKDIVPPKEEELYLLINGLSLSDDENVRDMWAGLFAKALDPNSEVLAERPFISVLQTLSPMDARIIDLLAFIVKTDRKLRLNSKSFSPTDIRNISREEQEELNHVRKINMELHETAILAIKSKAEEYGLKRISNPSWAQNLLRQGVIERTQLQQRHFGSFDTLRLDERGLMRSVQRISERIGQMEQSHKRNSSFPKELFSGGDFGQPIQLEVQLSDFGKRLAEACGVL